MFLLGLWLVWFSHCCCGVWLCSFPEESYVHLVLV